MTATAQQSRPTADADALLDTRRSEWGNEIPVTLVRDFIHSALRHSAVADFAREYVFGLTASTTADEPPPNMGEALRLAIDEVLNAATREDWRQVSRDLLSDARETVSDDLPPARTPETPIPAACWSPLPAKGAGRRRKAPVKIPQEAILEWLTEVRSATVREIAQHFGISTHTARMKSDGLAAQGKLDVRPGARAHGSRPVIERRYSIPAPVDPPANVGDELAEGRANDPLDHPRSRQ